jgi:parallel beta-helix repeat protein
MKRVVGLIALLIAVLTVTPAVADFYVIGGGGRLGTAITTLPVAITIPGVYYLTKNLTISDPELNAITVGADDVTIDLMGFCLTGPGKASGALNSGIRLFGTRSNVEIRNGSIKAFGFKGIKLENNLCTGIRVVGVRVRDTGNSGIDLPGSGNLVMDCTVMNAGSNGIDVGNSSLVKGSQVVGSGNCGIKLLNGSTAVGNTALGNVYGILTEWGSMVTDNTVSGNSSLGISCLDKCTISRNTVYNTTGTGISAGAYCTITNNTTDGLTNGANCAPANNAVNPE